jgi:hypothetical protein
MAVVEITSIVVATRKEKRFVISTPSAKLRVNSGKDISQIPHIRSE